jgi:RNA polymerase sigma factor (sigma-70 family)
MTPAAHERSDEDLLLAARDEPEAFAWFYRRHVRALAAYFWRRTHDAETTADLTAETFAAALDGCGRFDPARGPAIGWLYGIAHRQLGTLVRRGAVEQRARRRMGMARLELDDEELERVEADAVLEGPQARVLEELAGLPPDQRAAVEARVVHELDYAQIAHASGVSELVARKRVSRGLAALRGRLGLGRERG